MSMLATVKVMFSIMKPENKLYLEKRKC